MNETRRHYVSEISQESGREKERETETQYGITFMGNLKKLNSYKQRVKQQLPSAGYMGNRVILVKRYKLSVIR